MAKLLVQVSFKRWKLQLGLREYYTSETLHDVLQSGF